MSHDRCERIQIAAMAALDGEDPPLGRDEIDSHVATCEICAAAMTRLRTMHTGLSGLSDDPRTTDIWPEVHTRITDVRVREKRERLGIWMLASVLVVWRAGQLAGDLPAPVLNSTILLAVAVAVLWWLAGDPFAIQVSLSKLRQEGAS